MPIVYITLVVGIALGYWIARKQLAGKFILAEEAMEEATWRAIEIENERHAPITPTPPLSEQWGLPNYHNQPPVQSHVNPLDLPLIREDGRPQWSAKQVIGYNEWGFERAPQYPGGLSVWDAVVNGITPDEDQ